MNRQAKLFNMGLRPVYRIMPKGRSWKRVDNRTTWNKGDDGLEINFQFKFD